MRRITLAAVLLAVLASCSPSSGAPATSQQPARDKQGAVDFTGGNRYDKSSYVDDVGRTVLSFRIRVRNVGSVSGRSPDAECHTTVDDERHDLQIYENPELAPGEQGWFRTGGPVPRLDAREVDNVEVYCDF